MSFVRPILFVALAAFGAPQAAAQIDLGSGNFREQLAPVGGSETTHFLARSVDGDPLWYGRSTAVLGDVDGDGADDFAILNPFTAVAADRVEIYSGASGTLIGKLEAHDTSGRVARVGDVDGDGLADIAVVVSQASTRISSGADGSTILEIPLQGAPAPAGDVDADGTPDLLLMTRARQTHVVSGADGSTIHVLAGGYPHELGGGPVSAALGDLDGDGHDDLLLASESDTTSQGYAGGGVVRVYSGRDGGVRFLVEGPREYAAYGRAATRLPDQDGDGVDDFAFSGYAEGAVGSVYAHSGATGARLFELQGRAGDGFGAALASAPDVDGDGVDDLLVGAPSRPDRNALSYHYWAYSGFQGAAFLYSGATLDLLHRFDGVDAEPFMRTGACVDGMGDVDGDGRGELLISSLGHDHAAGFIDSVVRMIGFEPHLYMSAREISAAAGGTIDVTLDFPSDAAHQPYKILMSGRLGGRTDLGTLVPLAADDLFARTRAGQYPFPGAGAMHGTLDGNGDRAFTLTVAPGALNAAVGRTYALAAVVQPAGQDATHASIQRTLTILP